MSRPERSASIVAHRGTKKTTAAVASTRTSSGFLGNDTPLQRSKSRSPSRNGSGSRSDPFTLPSTPAAHTIKRKRSLTTLDAINSTATGDDIDRGQRIKPKSSIASGSGQSRALAAPSGRVRVSEYPVPPSIDMQVSSTRRGTDKGKAKKERERGRGVSEYHVPPSIDMQGWQTGIDKGKLKQGVESSLPPLPSPTYSGPLAAAEYERMRRELETLKKENKHARKQLKKQDKVIEELRAQVAIETSAREEQEKLVAAVSSKSLQKEELLKAIEVSLQCQICIELISKPYALAPCGHILCLECLQQWFRSAPAASDDDMDAEAQEESILHREKSCPCCRATVLRRPVPVFMVKSVVTALRATAAAPVPIQGEEDADPWKGLFTPDHESPSDEDDRVDYESSEYDGGDFFDYSEDDLDGAEVELAMGLGVFPQELARFYESPSGSEDGSVSESERDEEEEEEPAQDRQSDDSDAVYTVARWEPPTRRVEFENVSSALWKMQRRGCTPRLIMLFHMRYTHDEGLVAHVSSLDALGADVTMGRNRLFLGWNIHIDTSDDTVESDPEKTFIVRQLRDIRRHPQRWMVTERHGFPGRGIVDARRLAPAEDTELYDTSDSEAYINDEDFM